MTIDILLPSQYLPILRPIPTPSALLIFLNRLQKLTNPTNIIINLVDSTVVVDSEILEEYERNFILGWLNRTLAVASRKAGEGEGEGEEEEGEEWIELLDGIASLLSNLSGHSAAGPSSSTYIFPTSNSLHPTLSITIQETTLLSSSTGFRTWGAAPLLSKAITLNPELFFPSPTSTSILEERLRVLELGSGTGLCSITAIKILELMERDVEVVMTDYEDEILLNLQYNLDLNSIPSTSSAVEVKIEHLDWSTYLPSSPTTTSTSSQASNRYPIILASDVIFEPQHTHLIHSVISSLLSFPSPSYPSPTFHIILPLRYTHSKEHDGFDKLFSWDPDGLDNEEEGKVVDEEGKKWRLRTSSRETLRGGDGFGKKGCGKEDSLYWLYRIGWESI